MSGAAADTQARGGVEPGGKIRVGFLSGVRHAVPYLDILAADPRVQLLAVAEEPGAPQWMRDDSRAAAAHAGIDYHEGLEKLLAPGYADVLVVCSEPTRHARLGIAALESGAHAVVDKPVAINGGQAAQIVEAASKSKGFCAVINRTHAPAIRRARAALDAGQIGLPLHIDAEFFADGAHLATSVERPELLVDPALSGGGEMLNFLGYCVDGTTYLTGLETLGVQAFSATLFDGPHTATGVEDTAVVSLGLEHGVTATITVSRVPKAPGLGPTATSMRIAGSHGNYFVDDDRPAITTWRAEGPRAASFDGGQQALVNYWDHVIGCAASGQSPDYTAEHAAHTLRIIDAAYRSAASGQVEAPLA